MLYPKQQMDILGKSGKLVSTGHAHDSFVFLVTLLSYHPNRQNPLKNEQISCHPMPRFKR